MPKKAVLILGNPKYITGNPKADRFYNDLQTHLESLGYEVSRDPGNPYTVPPAADVWVGHSRGAGRLAFAPKNTKVISVGAPGGINHPEDNAMAAGQIPADAHYILSKDMLQQLTERLLDS